MAEVTRRQRELLQRLAFREGLHPRECWLATMPRARYALIVPTMFGSYEVLLQVNGATLRTLEREGLITYGEDQRLPDEIARATLLRRRGEPWGSTVALTDAGRAIARGARDA